MRFFSILFLFWFPIIAFASEDELVIYGEYLVLEELGGGSFEGKQGVEVDGLIDYSKGVDSRDKAIEEALEFLNANVYGYSFVYRPGSTLMKTEELFELDLLGEIKAEHAPVIGEGVHSKIYRVKLVFSVNPSLQRWRSAFLSNRIRLEQSEGTSDFYSGWEGRSDAYEEALRNLVLITARKKLSSKPLVLKGDILLKGNPEFNVGAGRYYCRLQGFVNLREVVTYD
jgi:hypothetical protein